MADLINFLARISKPRARRLIISSFISRGPAPLHMGEIESLMNLKTLAAIAMISIALSGCAGQTLHHCMPDETLVVRFDGASTQCVAAGFVTNGAARAPPNNHPSSLEPHDEHGGPGEPGWNTSGLASGAPVAGTEIPLQRSAGGSYYLPVTVNQTLSVPFALDTGADVVQIPLDVYLVLKRNGTINPSDGRGFGIIETADGSPHKQPRFVIHELKVGDRVVTDVLGTVSPNPATAPLLGQSFLARLGSYTIDNQRHVLTLG